METMQMRAIATTLFALLLLTQTRTAFAQNAETSGPEFTLKLSQGVPRGEFAKGTQILIVRLTNTSHEWIREDACEAGGALYKLTIVYNGIEQHEPDWIRRRRETAEAGEANPALCMGSNPGRRIKSGEYWDDELNYPTDKPGTYQFRVELTLPQSLSHSTETAKSNTLTIVVP